MVRSLVAPTRALVAAALVLIGWRGWAYAGDRPTNFALPNGLRVRLVPTQGEREVVVLLGVRAGFFDEPSGNPHLAHVAEHLVVFAAPPGSDEGKAIARWYEAGKANAETFPGFMYFDIHVGLTELDAAPRVQAARLTRPEYAIPILVREVPRTLAELEYLERPETFGTGKLAFSAFAQAVLHGRMEVPIKERTRGITVEAPRRDHNPPIRRDGDGIDLGPARVEGPRQRAGRDIPELDRPVPAAADQRPPVGRERDRTDDVPVTDARFDVAAIHAAFLPRGNRRASWGRASLAAWQSTEPSNKFVRGKK